MRLAIKSGVIIPLLLMLPNLPWMLLPKLALAVYYAAWGRYFIGGGTPELLSAPLVGIPSPLAFAPIALLLISSYLLNSWWMLGAAVVFGTLHVWVKAVTG